MQDRQTTQLELKDFDQKYCKAGLSLPNEIIDDGKIHRFSSNGKPTDNAGWYVLFTDGIAAGAFGCWREGTLRSIGAL